MIRRLRRWYCNTFHHLGWPLTDLTDLTDPTRGKRTYRCCLECGQTYTFNPNEWRTL